MTTACFLYASLPSGAFLVLNHNCVFQMSTSFYDTIWAPISAIAIGTAVGTVAVTGVNALVDRHHEHLERLTVEQCLNRAWPSGRNSTMSTWCERNGYEVGSLY